MSKTKCGNCGDLMFEAHTREGLKVNFCPHLPASHVKSIGKVVKQIEIHCDLKIQGLAQTFCNLMNKAKANVTLDVLRKATQETVSDADLYENANLAMMLGLPADQLAELFEAAYALGRSLGVEPKRAIEALCKGIGRRSRLLLDNIGITFKPTDAYNWFASEQNLTKLTTEQKTEAWQKYAIHLIVEKAKRL